MVGITVNPYTTQNTTGTFGTSSQGYIQGTVQADPVNRFSITGGVVSSDEDYPMWGGVAITETLPASTSTALGMMGMTLARAATSEANIRGWIVSDQAYNGVITTTSQAPLYVQGGTANYVRLGSKARVVLKCTSTLASALLSASSTTACYWDFTNQQLTSTTGTAALDITVLDVQLANSITISYDTSSGYATYSYAGYTALVEI